VAASSSVKVISTRGEVPIAAARSNMTRTVGCRSPRSMRLM